MVPRLRFGTCLPVRFRSVLLARGPAAEVTSRASTIPLTGTTRLRVRLDQATTIAITNIDLQRETEGESGTSGEPPTGSTRETRAINRVNNGDSFPTRSRPEADKSTRERERERERGAFQDSLFRQEIRLLDRRIRLAVGPPIWTNAAPGAVNWECARAGRKRKNHTRIHIYAHGQVTRDTFENPFRSRRNEEELQLRQRSSVR